MVTNCNLFICESILRLGLYAMLSIDTMWPLSLWFWALACQCWLSNATATNVLPPFQIESGSFSNVNSLRSVTFFSQTRYSAQRR